MTRADTERELASGDYDTGTIPGLSKVLVQYLEK